MFFAIESMLGTMKLLKWYIDDVATGEYSER